MRLVNDLNTLPFDTFDMHEFDESSGWFSFDANTHLFAGKPLVKGAEFGCSALPNFENEFQQNFQRTLEYAKALNCKK